MIVVAQVGDRLDAEVTAINPGKSVTVSLESGETAILPWSGLAGGTDEGKIERGLKLQLRSPLTVDVVDVHLSGDLKRKIQVQEVGWTPPPRPARRSRRNTRKSSGVTYKTRDGIRVWRAQ